MRARIQSDAYCKLREMATLTDRSMTDVLSEAIDDRYRKWFIDQANQAYARLKAHSKSWNQELRERRAWEVTLMDGLKS